ncbi:MAG: hypothetical protein ACKVT2_05165 [Saprospiraceae bacterium]
MPAKTSSFHLLGAPGSGVTTLGKALAKTLKVSHFDTDDYHWFTDDALPYRRRRNPEHRRQLLGKDLDTHESWVLSGALCGWGDVFIPRFQAVVYCWLPAEIRLARIRQRELSRYGAERIAPGGDLHTVFEKFCAWAAAYDEDSGNVRSRAQEQVWLGHLTCPVLQIETEMSEAAMVESVLGFLRPLILPLSERSDNDYR